MSKKTTLKSYAENKVDALDLLEVVKSKFEIGDYREIEIYAGNQILTLIENAMATVNIVNLPESEKRDKVYNLICQARSIKQLFDREHLAKSLDRTQKAVEAEIKKEELREKREEKNLHKRNSSKKLEDSDE